AEKNLSARGPDGQGLALPGTLRPTVPGAIQALPGRCGGPDPVRGEPEPPASRVVVEPTALAYGRGRVRLRRTGRGGARDRLRRGNVARRGLRRVQGRRARWPSSAEPFQQRGAHP